jgi:heat shock protein HslJ
LVLVSWLAVLGCETARPSAPVTSPTSTPSGALPLAGTVWVADEIDGQRVVDGVASTIMFDGRAQAVGSTGCNRYVAPLHVAGSTLRLGDIAMTRRSCPPAVMDQERRFVVALGAIRTYHQEGDTLWLLDETGHVLVRLVRTQASASVRVNSDTDRRALREPGGRPEQEVVGSRVRRLTRQGGKASWTAAGASRPVVLYLTCWRKGGVSRARRTASSSP